MNPRPPLPPFTAETAALKVRFFVLLSWCLVALSLPAQEAKTSVADEIATRQAAYKAIIDAVLADQAKWTASLETWYSAGLDKILADRQQAGDLDGVVGVKGERDRLAAHQAATKEQARAMFPALRTLRGTFDTNSGRVLGEVSKRITAANQKYLADLDALQKQLTMSVRIEEAVQVKTEKERFAATLNAGSAPPTPAPPPAASRGPAPTAQPEAREVLQEIKPRHSELPVVIQGTQRIDTTSTFKPPVEITVVAKTDDTNLRLAYAADQLIFNWEGNRRQLRVDGGPAAGKHKEGAGEIPRDTFVTIRWVVTPQKQMVYVDDKLRYEHHGDYSEIDKPIGVITHRSVITIQSIKVRTLPLDQ